MRISREGALYRHLRSARNIAVIAGKGLSGVHKSTYINPSCTVSRDLEAEEYVYLGPECWIGPGVSIGRYTLLGPRVAIVGDDHRIDIAGTPMHFSGRPEQRKTRIGRDVWIGYGSVIMRGRTIGEGAIVAAHSVVTKDIPPYEIWAGSPARAIRKRFADEDQARHTARINGDLIAPHFAAPQQIDPREV